MLVLEARDRVGGRTLTLQEEEGKFWVDLGGSYVGPSQNHVLNLCEELKIGTYLVEDSKDIAYLRTSRRDERFVEHRARFSPQSDPKFGNLIHWLDYVHVVKLIDQMGAQIPAEAPWTAERARDWDAKTFRQFIDENTWTGRVRDYFNHIYVTIDVCADSNEVSLLWFLWYVKQCGGYGRSIATTNGGQERKLEQGTQQLSGRLQELVGRQRVLLNKPVCRIYQSSSPCVLVGTVDGSTFKADQVILALPPHLWLKIHYEPALPSGKNLLGQRSPMGQVGKVILYYERAFWKEHGFSGCFFIDSAERHLNPVILSLDETKPDGSHPAVIGFTGARGWLAMRDKSDEEVGKLVARSYANATKLAEFLDFKQVRRFDWANEQYSGGCYTSTQTANTLTKFGPHLRQPFGRLYFAGTETAIAWSGYMDGAISAGKRAAREVLHARGLLDKEQIWQEEPQSQLVPARPFEYPSSHRYAPSIGQLIGALAHLALLAGALTFVAYRRLSGSGR